jgi:hypothetical protein
VLGLFLTWYRNGQLKEYIAAGTSKEDFIRRLGGTTQSSANQSQPSSAPVSATPTGTFQQPQPSRSDDNLYDDFQPTTTSANSSANARTAQQTAAEKAKRAAAEKKAKLRAEAEEEARRRIDEKSGNEPANPEQAHANQVKLRKQQADEERKRILKRIEDDKRARREREAEERRARQLLSGNANEDSAQNQTASIPLAQRVPKAGQGDHCNLQVRLLDGSTIRTRFPSDKTLSQDVRKWIDEERTDGDAPYSFRVVLTPLPNKVIEPQEEVKSLLSLGLAPSATLVLIPTKYTAAFAHAGGVFSPVIGVFSTLYGVILASVGGIFGWFFGNGTTGHPEHEEIPMENLRARRRDAQLYNGNSVSVNSSRRRRITVTTKIPTKYT